MTRPHELILSGLPQAIDPAEAPASGFWFETYADGVDFGEPDENDQRTITYTTAACGYTALDLANAERVLSQRIGKNVRGVFEWLPPESGPRTLFRVLSSRMKQNFDDLPLVMGPKYMAYTVTLTCEAWAYPETTITETFAPGTATITVVDNCSANTNWPGLTAVTYLSVSAVQLGPISATATSFGAPNSFNGGQVVTAYGASGFINFSNGSAPTSGNYMYIEFASALSGFGRVDPPYLVVAGQQIAPSASLLQANGYMRYFWARRPGPLKFQVFAWDMASGDTANFYVGELGTSDLLPTGSLISLTTKGSVACAANLRIGRSGGGGVGETLIYADPSMLTNGWDPVTYASLANAPDGDYWIYVQPPAAYATGDVFSLTVAGVTRTTVAEFNTSSHWIPMGPFPIGGNKSRRLGTVSGISNSSGKPIVALLKNGSGTGFTSTPARLFREDEDASLIHLWTTTGGGYANVFIEPESIDYPQPGVFAGTATSGSDAISVLTLLKSWGWPRLIPPTTALWVQCDGTTNPSVAVTHRPPFHTSAAEY